MNQRVMPEPPMVLPTTELKIVSDKISETIQIGGSVRSLLEDHSGQGRFDLNWEVDAAVEALNVLVRDGLSKFCQHCTLLATVDSTK